MNTFVKSLSALAFAVGATLMVGCTNSSMNWSGQDNNSMSGSTTKPANVTATPAANASTPAKPAQASNQKIIRVRAGNGPDYKDKAGNTWEADHGFADGQTVDRDASLAISGTNDPDLFRTERYSMTAYSFPVPNGRYKVNLYFAETYEGITGPGQRVFSFSIEGKEHKDMDLYKESGFAKVKVVSETVDVKDGKLDITFTPNIENPEINAFEIIPA